jgi:stearoyl-CoA desaturase (delta-9 desaturase)
MIWAIALFLVCHWYISLFCQTFFLHRYAAHRIFTMSKGWERFFYLLTFASQGSSYLVPRAYAILHRMHHAYSDTEKDPHSPHLFKDIFSMMWNTKIIYSNLVAHRRKYHRRFYYYYPQWEELDRLGDSWPIRIAWGTFYTLFYIVFAPSAWFFLLIPVHYFIGPIHGALVNWCGHKYGYRNYSTNDHSRNTLLWDFALGGELFQNNHHQYPARANFAVRWYEADFCYYIMKPLHALGIIKYNSEKYQKRKPA